MAATTSAKGLYAALLEVQKEAPQLHKDATAKVIGKKKDGGIYEYSYTYITLTSLLAEVLPILNKHNVVVVQAPIEINGQPSLLTKLVHAPSGEEMESATPLLLSPGSDSQAWGGAVTYTRRYALITMLGLSAEDDDGASAKPKPQAAKENGKGETQFVAPPAKPAADSVLTKLKARIDAHVDAGRVTEEAMQNWAQNNYNVALDKLPPNAVRELNERLDTFEKNLEVPV